MMARLGRKQLGIAIESGSESESESGWRESERQTQPSSSTRIQFSLGASWTRRGEALSRMVGDLIERALEYLYLVPGTEVGSRNLNTYGYLASYIDASIARVSMEYSVPRG